MEFKENENIGTMPVLEKHAIDSAALQEYMQANINGFDGKISIEEFKGGQSNPTYKVVTPSKSYVLRRKPPGKLLKSAHAVDREYRVITALNQTNVPVPTSYALCEDESIIGLLNWIKKYYCIDKTSKVIFEIDKLLENRTEVNPHTGNKFSDDFMHFIREFNLDLMSLIFSPSKTPFCIKTNIESIKVSIKIKI